jgi:transcription antitermination factor NusG
MQARWFVLRSKPCKETALCRYARSNGHEIFFPTIPVNPVNPRASKTRPYFPGYLFVFTNLREVSESTFRWMPFSQGLVHVGGEPAPVADPVVEAIQRRIEEIWEAGGLTIEDFRHGDHILIQSGVFEGYEGIFSSKLSGKQRVSVLLKMIHNRYVPAVLDLNAISKIKH